MSEIEKMTEKEMIESFEKFLREKYKKEREIFIKALKQANKEKEKTQ